MRTQHYFSRSAVAALAAAAFFLISSPAAAAADAQTLTGTFVVWLQIAPGVRLPSVQTYSSDGAFTCSDSTMFGGLPGATTRNSPCQGVWERTGPNSFALTGLTLFFDAGSGLLIGFGRARATVSFTDKDANQISGTVLAELLSCPSPFACPDPQAADAAWVPFPGFPPSLQVTGTRLRLVQ